MGKSLGFCQLCWLLAVVKLNFNHVFGIFCLFVFLLSCCSYVDHGWQVSGVPYTSANKVCFFLNIIMLLHQPILVFCFVFKLISVLHVF